MSLKVIWLPSNDKLTSSSNGVQLHSRKKKKKERERVEREMVEKRGKREEPYDVQFEK